jgi:hypothetical protein
VIQATIKGIPKPPKAPSDLSGEPGELENTLHWKDNSNNETNFTVYANNVKLVTLPANTISYLDKPRGNLETVKYWVTALNQRGESPASNIIYVTTLDTTPPTVDIVGNISTSTGLLVGGVNITFSGYSIPAVSDGNGNYSMTVDYNYTGIAIPSANGYTFNPVNRSYTNVTTNQISQNYTAINNPVNISGYVKDNVGNGLIGAIITFSGGGGITTNSMGFYTKDVVYGFSGTTTLTLTGWTFSPSSISYNNIVVNQVNQNYIGTHIPITISGYIRDGANNGVSGVVAIFSNAGNATTDISGFYTKDVVYGYTGTVTPTLAGWTFNPSSISYNNVIINQLNQNYIGVYNNNISIWYIDPNGTALDPHTWLGAWKTFSAINWTSIKPGDIIYISGGVTSQIYYETLIIKKSGTPGHIITITKGIDTGHNGEIIIDGKNTLVRGIDNTGTNWDGYDYIKVSYLTIRRIGGNGDGGGGIHSTGFNVNYFDHINMPMMHTRGFHCTGIYPGTITSDSLFITNCKIISDSINSNQTDGMYLNWLSNIFIEDSYIEAYNQNNLHCDIVSTGNWIENINITRSFLINKSYKNGYPDNYDNGLLLQARGIVNINNSVISTPNFDNSLGWCISFSGTSPNPATIYFYNNTVYTNKANNAVVFQYAAMNSNSIFKNNIFYGNQGVGNGFDYGSGFTASNINYNLYYTGGSTICAYNGVKTLAQMKTAGAELNGLNALPLFKSPSTFDYSLLNNSPGINVGIDLGSQYSKDITGKIRTGIWDMGAYESNVSSSIVLEGPNSWKINPNGTGLAPHTWAGGWKTLSAINWTSVQPGDTIFVFGGADSVTYNEALTVGKSGAPNKFITIMPGLSASYNGKVIISVSSGNGININQQNPMGIKQYIRIKNITVKMQQITAGGYGIYVSSRVAQGCNVIYLDKVQVIWNLNGTGSSSTEQFGIKVDGYGGGTSYVDSVFIINSYVQNIRTVPSINVQCDGIVLQNLSNIFVLNNKVVVNNDTPGRNDTPHNDPIGVNASIYNLTIANNILINSQDVNTCSNGIILGALSGKFDMYNNVLATPFFGWTNGEVPQSLSIYSVTTGTYFYIYNNTFEGGSSPYVVMSRNSNNPYVYFKNNIVAARESGSFRVAFENSTPTWNQINGNLYTTYAKSSSNGLINGYSMTTLRTTYGAETVGIGSDRWNIAESSLFNNYLNYDYSLKDGSPAIDKGVYLGPPYDKDITGKTRSNPPDIGAYEK